MKRLLAFLLTMMLLLSAGTLAEEDRYGALFDTANDAGQLTIRFLDLGPKVSWDRPGDSMILTSPDGKTLLLDTGNSTATGYVTGALDAMGVTHLDYILISHPHSDHVNGLYAILDQYGADIVYTSNFAHDYQLNDYGVTHIRLHEGDSFSFGGQVRVDVYNPPEEIAYPEQDDYYGDRFYNDHSLALKFTYGTSTVMLAGDLYMSAEREIVERWGDALDCDVMKANHHGGDTSSCAEWLEAVSPNITVFTCDTLAGKAYRKIQKTSAVYHTLFNGCVRIRTPGDSTYEVYTELTEKRTTYENKNLLIVQETLP